MPTPDRPTVVNAICEQLREEMDLDPSRELGEATRLKDLGADSLDLYVLLQELEDTYGLRIDPDDAKDIATVSDAADRVLTGLATAAG